MDLGTMYRLKKDYQSRVHLPEGEGRGLGVEPGEGGAPRVALVDESVGGVDLPREGEAQCRLADPPESKRNATSSTVIHYIWIAG